MPTKARENTSSGTKQDANTAGPTRTLGDAAALQAFGFNTVTGMGLAWVEALSDMGSEVLSFVADRIKEDVKTQHQLLHCRDIAEMQEIQSEFVRNAIEQYTAETGKLVAMSQNLIPTPDKQGGS